MVKSHVTVLKSFNSILYFVILEPIIATSKPTTAIVTDFTVELKCLRVFYSKDGALAAIVRWKVPGN